MPAERVIVPRERNRALLARQGLLERLGAPLPRALERVGGIQAQYAPSMYVGLWSRVAGFEREALTRALERRTVVQATLMRSTIHLVSRRDPSPLALAVREARRRWWLRVSPNAPPAAAMAAAAQRLRAALRGGALPRAEVERIAGRGLLGGVGLWLDLVRVPPSGTWERRRADYARGAGVLAEEHRPRIFSTRNPHSAATFLVDGTVAGTWRHEGGRIRLAPFGRLTRAARAELGEEGERLSALHA
jgi:Winged helix DNA-binding domain